MYTTRPKSAELDSGFSDYLEGLNDSFRDKTNTPNIYEGLRSIEGISIIKTKNTLLFLSPNTNSLFQTLVSFLLLSRWRVEMDLADLPMLDQPKMLLPNGVPPGIWFSGIGNEGCILV
jgi:hypothetical protein